MHFYQSQANSYRHVEPIVVLQGFTSRAEDQVRDLCRNTPWPETFSEPLVLNVPTEPGGDHRARLANERIAARPGRYLAFLDYDDRLYASCYERLVARLRDGEAAVAVGGVVAVEVEVTRTGEYVLNKTRPFRHRQKYDFFADNQYPIHTLVIDTRRVNGSLLQFDPGVTRLEDYAFLLRILAAHCWNDSEFANPLGEYVVRIDGSNTILLHSADQPDNMAAWLEAAHRVDGLKRNLDVSVPCP